MTNMRYGPEIIVYSGEPFALPEGQEDLHLHPLPRPDDLQAATWDKGCWHLDDWGDCTAELSRQLQIILHVQANCCRLNQLTFFWILFFWIWPKVRNPGESRFGDREPNLLACQRCLGPDLLSWTDRGFQSKDCNIYIIGINVTVTGTERGLCDSWGELETYLWCTWAGLNDFYNIQTCFIILISFWKLTFKKKDSLPLHEPWHSDLPNFLRLVFSLLVIFDVEWSWPRSMTNTSLIHSGCHQHSPSRQDVWASRCLHIRPPWSEALFLLQELFVFPCAISALSWHNSHSGSLAQYHFKWFI